MTPAKPPEPPDATAVLSVILRDAGPRPYVSDAQSAKNQYAIRFAEHMADRFAADLRHRLPGITATTKRTGGSEQSKKQLDVNFSTREHGLVLGISLKSVHLRDVQGAKRYTHNMKRNEEELRIEASGYHKRQPYAVMVGVLCLPFDSCEDGKKGNPSSFGSWVRHLRPYAGRREPGDDIDKFEKLFIALYEPDGSDFRFFDVESDPPKNQRPPAAGDLRAPDGRAARLLTYAEFLDDTYHRYLVRNAAEFRWASGEEEPLTDELSKDDES